MLPALLPALLPPLAAAAMSDVVSSQPVPPLFFPSPTKQFRATATAAVAVAIAAGAQPTRTKTPSPLHQHLISSVPPIIPAPPAGERKTGGDGVGANNKKLGLPPALAKMYQQQQKEHADRT